MPLPWVSRALYERVLKELEESEKERKVLLDRILGVDPVEAITQALPDADSKEAESLTDNLGKLDASALRARFRRLTQQPRVG